MYKPLFTVLELARIEYPKEGCKLAPIGTVTAPLAGIGPEILMELL